MVATQLSSYADKKDKNGVIVSSWAVQLMPGVAMCKSCVPNRKISFKKGKGDLFSHSESEIHVRSIKEEVAKRGRMDQYLEGDKNDDLKKQSKDLEIAIVAFLSRHSVPPGDAECLIKILKRFAPDSDIIQNVTLGREKARYLTIHGIGDTFEKETLAKMKNCDAFSVQIDESEVNKVSQLEVVAKLATVNEGIEIRHYKCLDLEKGDAETITDTLLDAFNDDEIDFKAKLIDVGMDGCSTMQGHKSGVIKRLMERVPQLVSTGSCNSHNCSNTMQHSTEAFDVDMKNALVDLHQDLGGAKGRGLKKKKEFEAVCKSIGLDPVPIKRFVSTRFRTLRYCIKPVLDNFVGIVQYYKSVKKPTVRQKRLIKYFVERCDINRIRLKFIFAATRDLNNAIDFFEEQAAHIHNTSEKLEQVLSTQYRKVLDESELTKLDEETDELRKKSKKELVNLDLDKARTLTDKELFIGQDVEKEIKSFGLTPSSPQLAWFFTAVRKFHMTACRYLQKYFKKGLSSIIMENMTALSPTLQSHILTADKLKSLSLKYSKVIDNIQPVDGLDRVSLEIKRYITDDDVKELEKENFEEFWKGVSELTDGSWCRYEILPRFALALGTKHDATGDVERGFSTMNIIHQNKQRNCMEQETLNAHMHIKTGVEGQEIVKACMKCKSSQVTPHCHCEFLIISEQMRANCKTAHEKCKNAQRASSIVRNEATAEMIEKKEESDRVERVRIEKVKNDILSKKQFVSSKLLEPIYQKTVNKQGDCSLSSSESNNASASSSKSSSGSGKSSSASVKSLSGSSKSSLGNGKSSSGIFKSSRSDTSSGNASRGDIINNNNKKRKAGN